MPEVEMVEGGEIPREEANSPRWSTVVCRSKKVRAEAAPGIVPHKGVKGGRRTAAPQGVAKRLAAASRLPRLPRDHIRSITEGDIVYPNIARNILVVSTPKKRNAQASAGIQQIRLGEGSADAYPNSRKKVSRGCELVSPTEDHLCSPKCPLCWDAHTTAERLSNNALKFLTSSDAEDCSGSAPGRFSNSWPRRAAHVTRACQVFSAGHRRSLSRRRSRCRGLSRSRGRFQNGPTEVDRAKPTPEAPPKQTLT
ncbi:hypothetical protein HPB48_020650 [Haemaphysalis longicornis]|uniref:Uncharacterized protein n=1 Tax=Haemaphysalis longicornis TaxID=44386 RepID=A0A9J6FYY1_HAELO|nr:hypothetical protein HPB48_020650 [Haemaphysalis longicornis]